MASKLAIKKDGKIEVERLDACYEKEYDAKAEIVIKYNDYKKTFQKFLKMAGASGTLPMADADYKKLAEAGNLKKIIAEMHEMQVKAHSCTRQIAYVTAELDNLVEKDATDATDVLLKTVVDAVGELENEVAKLQDKIKDLNKKKSDMATTVRKLLKVETKNFTTRLEGLKKEVPTYVSGKPPFQFDIHNKYLKAKMK